MYRDLLYDVSDNIATVTLNRPDRLNAISIGMLASFSDAFRAADADPNVRAIILTGAGRGFCAGLDLKEQGGAANSNSINGAGGLPAKFDLANSPPIVLHQTDKPVICALNGAAAGYGLDLALGCDIIIAADTAKLAAVFTQARRPPRERRHLAPAAPHRLDPRLRARLHAAAPSPRSRDSSSASSAASSPPPTSSPNHAHSRPRSAPTPRWPSRPPSA